MAKIIAQSSADNKKGDSTQKRTKVNQPILEISISSANSDEDDSQAPPSPCPKKTKRRKHKKKATVIDSDDSLSDDQAIKKTKCTKINLAPTVDTDIEEIQNPKENSEEELGEN